VVPIGSEVDTTESPEAEPPSEPETARRIGRYELHDEIATGGMATVHLGKLRGDGGFHRIVAIKRLHAHYAKDPMFVRMFQDEARLAGRVTHPNVIAILDVVAENDELFSVMEYVAGETLSRLARTGTEDTVPTRVSKMKDGASPPPSSAPPSIQPNLAISVILAIAHDVLLGLHAAHEATDEHGEPLGLVHRDVSPQNILVGVDGRARVLDFGVAKAAGGSQTTESGVIKGKLAYMPPEQVYGEKLDRRADIYAMGVVLWELLAGRRLFVGHDHKTAIGKVLNAPISPPGMHRPSIPGDVDEVVMRALDRDVDGRYATALEMAEDIARRADRAPVAQVKAWVERCAKQSLSDRGTLVSRIESLTQLASVTDFTESDQPIASSDAPSSSPRIGGRAAMYIVAAIVVLVGVWTLRPTATSPTPSVASAPVSGAPPAVTTRPAAAASAAASASVSLSVTGAPAASNSPPSRALSAPKTLLPSRPPPVKRPASNCNPPYILDAKGHKRYKRGCLK